jgi:hypothetical protein
MLCLYSTFRALYGRTVQLLGRIIVLLVMAWIRVVQLAEIRNISLDCCYRPVQVY